MLTNGNGQSLYKRVGNQRQWFSGIVYTSLLALLVVLVSAPLIGINRIHLGPPDRHLNDQVGYIAAARNLERTGKLDANIIYPSTLYQDTSKNVLYLPGHYYALAISYVLFDFGVLQSYLPNLAAYLLSAICVFLIGYKLYNTRVGFLAASLFIFFPINILYAYTAMSELTLVFMAILAIGIFIYLPTHLKPYLGPVLLILPLFFRETAVFLTIPMTLMIYDFKRKNLRAVAGFIFLSIVVTLLLFRSSIASGRPSLLLANIFDDRFETLYQDAYTLSSINPQPLDWVSAIANKIISNLKFLIDSIIHFDFSFDLLLFYTVLGVMILALVSGILKRDIYQISAGSFILALFGAILSLYAIYSYRGLRVILIALPVAAVGIAAGYHRFIENRLASVKVRLFRVFPIFLYVIIAFISLVSVAFMANRFQVMDPIDDQHLNFMESIGHDDQTLLAAPYELALYYIYQHYPVRYSFLPKNPPTLDLLAERYNIGTLILPIDEYLDFFSPSDFEKHSLFLDRVEEYAGVEYMIWRANPADDSTLGKLIE